VPPPRASTTGYPRGGLHGQIVHELGRRILSGEILPGELIPAQPGPPASRTVLREAIKVLVAKGLVESRPKTGTRVRERGAWNLLDPDVMAWQQDGSAAFLRKLTEVRFVIEPAAAELAAQRAREPEIQAIENALRDMEQALGGEVEDYEAFDRADIRFHTAIVRASGNELLEHMGQVAYSGLAVSFRATSRVAGRARASLPEHRAILEAIKRHSGPRAARAMRVLVRHTATSIEALPPSGAPEPEQAS